MTGNFPGNPWYPPGGIREPAELPATSIARYVDAHDQQAQQIAAEVAQEHANDIAEQPRSTDAGAGRHDGYAADRAAEACRFNQQRNDSGVIGMARVRRKFICPPKRLRLTPTPDDLRRFLAKVQLDPASECWNWIGGTDHNGYGQFKIAGQARGAHRVAYAIFVRTIPDGREVDHDCENPTCVNPLHLIATRPLANAKRGGHRRHDDDIPF
jgi:hypothetical protein